MIRKVASPILYRIRVRPYTRAVSSALAAWDLTPRRIDLLSWSENLVFRVDIGQPAPVVARLHRPGTATEQQRHAESLWLADLAETGVAVGRPLLARDGRSHVLATVRKDDERSISVMAWVEGIPLADLIQSEPGVAPKWRRAQGELLAEIHNHAEKWDQPAEFAARRWDHEGLVGESPLWGRFWEVEVASADQARVLVDTVTEIRHRLLALGTDSDVFGLIHADLSAANLMVDGADIVAIDFDDFGYGWHAYDLAAALFEEAAEASFSSDRDSLIAGYRNVRTLSPASEAHLQLFLLLRGLALMGWLAFRRDLDLDGSRTQFELLDLVERCERFLGGEDPYG